MRTTATIGITRLLGWMLLAGGLLVASCASDEEQKQGGNPDEPGGESGDRREVVLTLKNKLALAPALVPGTKADVTKAISTAAENDIRTLDVYVFGSDTEDGEYTYQERFAYRAGNNDKLPAGANELQLAVQGADGAEATGLLKLKRGLFVKLYCIANDTLLVDPAGDGTPVKYTAFKPLTLTAPGETGTKVATPGVPLESSFVGYHTHLLTAAAKGDTLSCPLAMSGALTTALDLTSFENSARLQAGFKLTRLAARFDIQNVSTDSRFTLQSVSMGNGRRGSGYFPIRVCGDLPTAKPADLITYPVRSFYGDRANNGLCVSAFYSYPSPQADKGYLILKGLYKVNETENKEVSYQIPFRQMTPNGQEMYLDINHNHRYTIAITAADAYHLDANITVADWADDGSIEYTPENTPGEIIVTIPPEFAGETGYNEEIKTMNMSIKTGSTFKMAITTNSTPKISKTYAGGVAGQLQNWLTVSEPAITPDGTLSTYTYTVSLTTPYTSDRYPRVTLRLTNTIDGSESLLFVEPIAVPFPIETPQPPKAPNGKSDNPNTFDPEMNTASLYRITGSQAQVKINCPDGIGLDSKPDWLKVDISTVGAVATATLTLSDRDVVVADNKGTVTFHNKKNADLKIDVYVTLLDAPIVPSYDGIGADNKVESGTGDIPDNVIVVIKKDNKATVKTSSLDGVSVTITYEPGSPEWLQYEGASSGSTLAAVHGTANGAAAGKPAASPKAGPAAFAAPSPATFAAPNLTALGSPAVLGSPAMPRSIYAIRAIEKTNELVFSPIESKLAGAKKAIIQMTNIIGGKDCVITMTPEMQAATAVKGAESSLPVQDALDAVKKTLTLYQLPGEGAETSKMQVTVSSLGGSVLAFEGEEGGLSIKAPAESTANSANYLLIPTLATDKNKATGTLHVKNYTDRAKMTDYAVTVLRSDLTGTGKMSLPAVKDQSATLKVSSHEGFKIDESKIEWDGGTHWFNVSILDFPAGVDKVVTVVANGMNTKVRPAILTLKNKIVNGGDLRVIVTPEYAVPALTAGTIPANSYNTLTATPGSATSTAKIYRVSGSNLQFKATTVGGSKVTGTPVGVTVTRNGGDDYNTDNTYTVTWDGKTTADGSFQLVNSQSATKVQTVTVQLPATTITPASTTLALSTSPGSVVSNTINSPEGFTAAVSWGGGGAWFDLDRTDVTTSGNQSIKATVKSNLNGINIQTATITLTNKIAGVVEKSVYTITPTQAAPTVAYVANSSAPVQNTFDGTTATLYSVAGSKLNITATAIGGTKVLNASGVTVASVSGGNSFTTTGTYSVTLNNGARSGSFTLANNSDASKTKVCNVTVADFTAPVVSSPSAISPPQNSFTGGNTVNLYNISNSTLSLNVSSFGGTKVVSTTGGANVTGGGNANQNNVYAFTWNGDPVKNGYQVVFANFTDPTKTTTVYVNVLLEDAITAIPTSVTVANSATNNIPVTSTAGCTVGAIDWGGGCHWFDVTTNPSAGSSYLVITQGHNSFSNQALRPATVTLNSNIGGASTTVTITPTGFAAPVLTPIAPSTIGFYLNGYNTGCIKVEAAGGFADEATSSNPNVATVSRAQNMFDIYPVSEGTAIITVANASDPSLTSTYNITVANKTYEGKPVWKYYGYYIAPEEAAYRVEWTSNLSDLYCRNKLGAKWYVPEAEEWREILGGTSGDGRASGSVLQEYKKNNIFSAYDSYWSSTPFWQFFEGSSENAYRMFYSDSYMQVHITFQYNPSNVRCVAKDD